MGIPWGAPDDLNTFMAMVNNVPEKLDLLRLLDRPQRRWPIRLPPCSPAAMSASGLEDNLYVGKGMLATNAQLVEKAVQVVEGMGARIIGPDDVREKLKLTKR